MCIRSNGIRDTYELNRIRIYLSSSDGVPDIKIIVLLPNYYTILLCTKMNDRANWGNGTHSIKNGEDEVNMYVVKLIALK